MESGRLLGLLATDVCYNGGTAEDLRRRLLERPTRMFVFSGHADAPNPSASGAGGLQHTLGFTRPGGGLDEVRPEDIASILGASRALELAFLNGCESEPLGEAARRAGVATVVCWRTKAEDSAARHFAQSFFHAVANDCNYREAFGQAVHALRVGCA